MSERDYTGLSPAFKAALDESFNRHRRAYETADHGRTELDDGMKPGDFPPTADLMGTTVIDHELKEGRSVNLYTKFGPVTVLPHPLDSDAL